MVLNKWLSEMPSGELKRSYSFLAVEIKDWSKSDIAIDGFETKAIKRVWALNA